MKCFLIWAVTNVLIIGCFTALAMFFGKWWIVLFTALFTYGFKTHHEKEGANENPQ